jgi:aromatase
VTSTELTESGSTHHHHTEHTTAVAAPADTVFGLLADVAGWPQLFAPTIHVEVLKDDPSGEQLLQIWATARGSARTWTSKRQLDAGARRISFRQTVPSAPLAWMTGEWQVTPEPKGCSVTLLHDYRVVDDDPAGEELVAAAVENNSVAELSALKTAAERAERLGDLLLVFSDSETITGSAQDVYDFINDADRWPERLPHVSRLEFAEVEPGIQTVDMDTVSPDGSTHNTTSVRVAFPDRRTIVYKQLRVPEAMSVHTGRWVLEQNGGTVTATSWHTVVLDPDGIRKVLGPQAGPADARALVRKALGTNSLTTLRHAKSYAESRSGA